MLYHIIMLNITPEQPAFEFVCLEQLIAQDHLLRKIGAVLDFEFIWDEVKHIYTDSPHLKSNANKIKFDLQDVEKSTKSYLAELDADINTDRIEQGKKYTLKRLS